MYKCFIDTPNRCPDCTEFTAEWEKVGREFKGLVKVADLDCAENNKVCNIFSIVNYPTFVWFENGIEIERNAAETTRDELISYAKKRLSKRSKRDLASASEESEVVELTDKTFNSTIRLGVVLTNFCVPWCQYCKKSLVVMQQLSNRYKDNSRVKITKLNCLSEKSADSCFAEVRNGVPTVNLYVDGARAVSDFSGNTFEDFEELIECGLEEETENKKQCAKDRKRKRTEP